MLSISQWQGKGEEASDKIEMRDAAMFPLYASGGLFGLYLFFKVTLPQGGLAATESNPSSFQYVPKEYVNLLLSVLFFGLGVSALTRAWR